MEPRAARQNSDVEPVVVDPTVAKVVPEMAKKMKEFKENMVEVMEEKLTKLSNLTCIMKETGSWTEDNEVNMEFLTQTMWEGVSSVNTVFKISKFHFKLS